MVRVTPVSKNGRSLYSSTHQFGNCLLCVFKPVLYYGLVTTTMVNFNCNHCSTPPKISLKISLKFNFIGWLIVIGIVATTAGTTYEFISVKMPLMEKMFVLNELLMDYSGMILYSMAVLKSKYKVMELTGLAGIAEESQKFGIIYFEDVFVCRMRRLTYSMIIFFCLSHAGASMVFISNEDCSSSAIKIHFIGVAVFLESITFTHYVILILTFKHMFQRIFQELENLLQHKLLDPLLFASRNIECGRFISLSNVSFETKLQLLRRFYSSTVLIFIGLQQFLNPSLLIIWNAILILTTLGDNIIIKGVISGEYLSVIQNVMLMQIYGNLFGLYLLMIITDSILKLVRLLISSKQELLILPNSVHFRQIVV